MSATLSVSEIYNKYERKHSTLAMIVSLISVMMLFAALFMGYAVYRFQNTAWPPMGFEKVSLLLPTASTIVIILSSLTYHFAYIAFGKSESRKFKWLVYATLLFGAAFLVSQTMLWSHLTMTGLYVESGIFSSILHGFTWIHAAHVVLAVAALIFYILPICFAKEVQEKFYSRILNVGKFWHFLGFIWLLMYVFIFVI